MIRQPAAEKLARTLLEMRPSRIAPLSDEFYLAVAKIIMAHVALDEQQNRGEKISSKPTGPDYPLELDESKPQLHEGEK